MFQLTNPKIFNITSFSFEHSEGYRLVVLPAAGATIMDLAFRETSILETYESEEELQGSFFYKNEILAPFPNRIKNGSYKWNDKTYQFPINNPEFQSALHGFVYDKPFEVITAECYDQSCSIQLLYKYSGDQGVFPFPFDLELTYSLDIKEGFRLDYRILNTGVESMPVGFGWHPYFTFGGEINEAILTLPKVKKIEVDENMIPIGERIPFNDFIEPKKIGDDQLDTCFEIVENSEIDRINVSLEYQQNRILYWQNVGTRAFNFLQLYTPSDRSSIAIEPMTCNVDAFNNGDGLVTLNPNEEIGSSCGVNYYENLF